ncbi:hypothetical protein ECIV_ORF100 [European chub iridovirus]|nr:hypothetical protein ECIV_ORF100 [European chub iridovirus]
MSSLPGFEVCNKCVDSTCVDNRSCQQRVNKRYVDPAIIGQPQYALVSFVPAGYNVEVVNKLNKYSHMCKGNHEASNEMHMLAERVARQKLFAVCKVRAVAFSECEAKELARNIVKNVDSLHTVYTVRIGHPFPVHSGIKGMAEDTDHVTLQKDMEESLSEAQKRSREAQKQEIREVEQRAEMFKAEDQQTADAEPGSMDEYIRARYKYAMQRIALKQLEKEMEVIRGKCNKTREFIVTELRDSPHKDTYMNVLKEKMGHMEDDMTRYLSEDL